METKPKLPAAVEMGKRRAAQPSFREAQAKGTETIKRIWREVKRLGIERAVEKLASVKVR